MAPAPPPLPFAVLSDHVRVDLWVTPRGARDAIEGVRPGPDGPRLKVRVRAVPEDGKANAAVIRLLAKAWGLPAGRLTLVSGAAARNKSVTVAGVPQAVAQFLSQWFDENT